MSGPGSRVSSKNLAGRGLVQGHPEGLVRSMRVDPGPGQDTMLWAALLSIVSTDPVITHRPTTWLDVSM
jgi:hypothetical protein